VANIVPNGDVTTGWSVLGGSNDATCAAGTHCNYVDEGSTPVTTDYVSTGTALDDGIVEEFAMTTLTNVSSATSVTVYFYMQSATNANGGTLDSVSINLRVNGTLQTATTVTPAFGAWGWHSATFTGSWDQTAVDSFQLYALRNKLGSGNPSNQDDDVRMASVYASVTYTQTAFYNQSSYRWFDNQDASTEHSFAETWGSTNYDYAYASTQTTDGGYALTGFTGGYGAGNYDAFLARYNSAGDLQWSATWGGTGADYGRSVVQAVDGGFVITGFTASYGAGGNDGFIAKFDSSGNLSWSNVWGGAGEDQSWSLVKVADGYAIAGYTASYGAGSYDMFLVKYDLAGTVQWSKIWGGANGDYGNSVTALSDGSLVVVGDTLSYGAGSNDVYIAKFSSAGVPQWYQVWGGTGVDQAKAVAATTDGNIIVTGITASYGAGANDAFVAKFQASNGSLSWSRTWGSTTGDSGQSIAATSDGGAVIGGATTYWGANDDAFIAKYDSSGTLSWSHTLSGSGADIGRGVIQTGDGGYVFSGHTDTYGAGLVDAFMIKYDSSGAVNGCVAAMCTTPTPTTSSPSATSSSSTGTVSGSTPTTSSVTASSSSPTATVKILAGSLTFAKAYGGTSDDVANSLTQTTDGGYAISGYTTNYGAGGYDAFLAKYDAGGTLSWSRTWGGTGTDVARSLTQTTDGGYAISGSSASYGAGGDDAFLAKYDSAGTLSWSRTWGGTSTDEAYSLTQTSDGGYAIGGYTSSYGAGGNDAFLAKYDSSGTLSWSRTWGGTGSDRAQSLTQTSDGGYAIAGVTTSYGAGGNDAFLAKYDSAGTLSWSRTWGGTGGDYTYFLTQTSDGGYAISGYTTSYGAGGTDVFLAKYDSAGTLSWSRTWGGAAGDTAYSLTQTTDGGYAIAGITASYGAGGNDAFLAKYDSAGNIIGCVSSICQSPTASTSSPTASTSSPTASTSSPTASTSSPTASTSSPTPTTTVVVATRWVLAAVDVGSPLNSVAQDTATIAPAEGTAFRLRYTAHVTNATANSGTFKLQYAAKVGTCDTSFTGESYADVSSSTPIAFYNNPKAIDSAPLTVNANDPVHSTDNTVVQQYQEADNYSLDNTTAIGEDAMWDAALVDNGAPASTSYCFRTMYSSGTQITSYTVVPEITTQPPTVTQEDYRWYKGQDAVPNNTFAQAWGGTGGDYVASLTQTTDGGYAIAGYTNSYGAGSYDAYLAKYDSAGTLSWSRTWGGTGSERANSLIQTSDGGYAIAGYTASYGAGSDDAFLAKYDSAGTLSWSRTWGSAWIDQANSLIQTSDGGYAMAGGTDYDGVSTEAFLAKYDSAGTLSWSRTWGGTGFDTAHSLIQTSDGGYAIAGTTSGYGAGGNDAFLAKYDSSGTLSWSRTWGGVITDIAYSLIQTTDGGYAIAGATYNYGAGGNDAYLAKYDSSGTLSWSRTWGGTGSDQANSIIQTSDGGYAIAGKTASYGAGSDDAFLAKYDSAGTLSWYRTWGGTGSDQANSLIQTTDGGYAITGYTASYGAGGSDVLLAKYDSSGNINGCVSPMCKSPTATTSSPTATTSSPTATVTSPSATTTSPSATVTSPSATVTPIVGYMTFAQTWGGTGNDFAESIIQTTDGGYAIAGNTASYGTGGGSEAFLAKYDASGTLSWSRTWGGTGTDYAQSLIQTSDGGYAIAGYTVSYGAGNADALLAKYNSAGTLSWSRTWGGTVNDIAYSLTQTTDGGYAIAGYTANYGAGSDDAFLAKYDSSGTLSWSRTWGGTGTDYAYSLTQTTDGGYAIAGYTANYGAGGNDAFLAKYDSSGTLSWSRTWGGTGTDYAYSLTQTTDGGYAIAGYTANYGAGSNDAFLAKYDSSGTLAWSRTWGGTGSDYAQSLTQTTDGGYAIAGYTASYGAGSNDVFLAKYDSSGTLAWSRTWGGTGSDRAHSLSQTTDGGYVIAGWTASYGAGGYDAPFVKYDSTGNINGCSSPMCQSPTPTTSSPTPTTSSPTPTTSSPTPTTSSPTPTTTTQVQKAIWGATVPIPGSYIGAQNTTGDSQRHDDPLRLRFLLKRPVNRKPINPAVTSLKLQVSPKVGTCDTSFTGESYIDLGSSAPFSLYSNTNLTNGTWAYPGPYDPTPSSGTLWYENYQQAVNFTNKHYIGAGDSGLWDISLTSNDAAVYNNYCFRVVNSDNSLLAGYNQVFELSLPPAAAQQLRHGQFFDTTETRQPFYW